MSEIPHKQAPLRTAAEARLAQSPKLQTPDFKPKPRRARELLHELDVHQIELEMQNDQLRQTQVELDSSRDHYADFYDFAPVGFLTLNHEGLIEEINLTGAALLGMERSKLLHRRYSKYVVTGERDRWRQFFSEALKQDEKLSCELAMQRDDGSVFYVQMNCLRLLKTERMLRIVLTDISVRKADEAKIWRLNQLYNALAQCNEAIVHSATEDELLAKICNVVTQAGGLRMAWFGFLDKAGKQIVPFASCGDGKEYLEGILILMDPESPYGRGPAAISIREDRPFWCQDFMHDPATIPWHERGVPYGWRALASLPLHRNGSAVGALSLYSDTMNAFDEKDQKLLVEMASNISYALDNFDREAERKRVEIELKTDVTHPNAENSLLP